MVYACEFEIVQMDTRFYAFPFGFEACIQASTFEGAYKNAISWFNAHILMLVGTQRDMPCCYIGNTPRRRGIVVLVALRATLHDVTSITLRQAGLSLGICSARVAQLCKSQELVSWAYKSRRMVTVASLYGRFDRAYRVGRRRYIYSNSNQHKRLYKTREHL